MNNLNKSFSINLSGANKVSEKTIVYFTKSGFQLIHSSEDKIEFKRGSILQNSFTFNPLKWKSKILVEIKEHELILHLRINTFGQLVTPREEKTWYVFVDNFETYLNDDSFDFKTQNTENLRTTKNNNLKLAGWAIIGGILGVVPTLIIGGITGYYAATPIFLFGGATVMVLYKISRDKKRTNTR